MSPSQIMYAILCLRLSLDLSKVSRYIQHEINFSIKQHQAVAEDA